MNIQDAYTQWSTTYDTDRNLTRDLDQIVTRATLESLRFESILEIGCGTGKNTSFFASIGARVCALDFSFGMLKQAQQKVGSEHLIFAVADLTRPWPCKPRSVDLVACNLVLEHIRDLAAIFLEASTVLAPGGRFFVSELHPFRQYQGTKANFQRAEERIEIPAFTHHISDFLDAARINGLTLLGLKEFWHEADQSKPPRLVSFMFGKEL